MSGRIVILTGGIGGAKLVLGMVHYVGPAAVTAVVNTGDDFEHLGLHISPDIDTLLYTLSGRSDPVKGWGRREETWSFMKALGELGGPTWFQLGDADLAVHVLRTGWLRSGKSLSEVTGELASRLGVACRVLPMSDQRTATKLMTDEGELDFQHYFVGRQCAPRVAEIEFLGASSAAPAAGVVEAVTDPRTVAIVIAPSNPFLSVDPILAVPGIKKALARSEAPVIAVSPLVGGDSVKGPTAKLMRELGKKVNAQSILDHYDGLVEGMVIDVRDSDGVGGVAQVRCDTLMNSLEDRTRVAKAVVELAAGLRQ